MPSPVVLQTSLPGLPVRRGKVRDVYDLGEQLLLVSTDRLSAFDWVLPTGIPDKGRVLTQISAFWFDRLGEPNHLITTDVRQMDLPAGIDRRDAGRPHDALPQDQGGADRVRGAGLPVRLGLGRVPRERHGLRHSPARGPDRKLPAAGTHLHAGHQGGIGPRREHHLRADGRRGRPRGERGAAAAEHRRLPPRRGYALERGIIIADTKFEFGQVDGQLLLIDEVLTPDSSRFWPADQYAPGRGQPSFDKQFVRDWLTASGWDKNSPPLPCPTTSWRRRGRSTSRPTSN